VLALLLAALLAPASGRAQVAADPAGLEPVIVELAIGRYGSRTVSAYRSSGDALLPLLQLAEMTELRSLSLSGGMVELNLEPGRRVVTLDPSKWEIRTGDGAVLELTPADRVIKLNEQYLSTRILSRLLRVTFAVDWNELAVTLLDADSLPVGRRLSRERAHALFRGAGRRGWSCPQSVTRPLVPYDPHANGGG
jgi:hypothetical protein